MDYDPNRLEVKLTVAKAMDGTTRANVQVTRPDHLHIPAHRWEWKEGHLTAADLEDIVAGVAVVVTHELITRFGIQGGLPI
jgi:hypothetical protein